ncbi:MAG: hypothetical protein IPK26_20340 [Planctomycetes bacterium]|nr:hypothetical protein [Planctomycetota bacterium]
MAARVEVVADPAAAPAHELAAALQACHEAITAEQAKAAAAERDLLACVAELAMLGGRLERALAEVGPALQTAGLERVCARLQMLVGAQRAAVARAGIETPDLRERTYDEVAELVTVESWREDARFSSEVVAEVLDPTVLRAGRLLRLGRVVMGCPLPPAARTVGESKDNENGGTES